MRRALAALLVTIAACSQGAPAPTTSTPVSSTVPTPPSTPPPTSPTTTSPPATSTTTEPPAPPAYLTWVSGHLPDGFGDLVASVAGVERVTVVSAGIGDLVASRNAAGTPMNRPPDGFAFPLEVFAVDRDGYAPFLRPDEAAIIASLGPDEVVLGATSAAVRGFGVDGVLSFRTGDDTTVEVRVAGVLPDVAVGGAEVMTVAGDAVAPGRLTPRYALVAGDVTKGALEAGLAAGLGEDRPFQVLAEGETPILRHADAVRPQSWIKLRFGEFAYRDGEGRRIEIDPAWVEGNIVEVVVPLLGRFKCHRDFAELLDGVMRTFVEIGASDVVDGDAFFGCWNPRWISDRRGLSRHAWGVAADINLRNATDGGPGSPVNPLLLEAMEEAGMTSGHTWVEPDPGHFEWYRDR